MPQQLLNVYPGLLYLLAYAHAKPHSHQWIRAILTILQRRGGLAHG
jgi:hypothetical protein